MKPVHMIEPQPARSVTSMERHRRDFVQVVVCGQKLRALALASLVLKTLKADAMTLPIFIKLWRSTATDVQAR